MDKEQDDVDDQATHDIIKHERNRKRDNHALH